ncbi:hypothetical protein D915_009398 [Fasciola hepatica]|uniref:Uncharacterized protein n=1 Tax=Fasciola hepatica TaxID=6192 RepID=A0A4E0R369_FASHE|nr:hypothetical protein D915_009398 [Fasciola hepatica]
MASYFLGVEQVDPVLIFNVLEEQNYLRFLNSITVAYFYPRGDKLSVVLHLELNRPHVDHEAINVSSISESISDGLFNQKHCNQTGHFWANVKYEAGNWTGSSED